MIRSGDSPYWNHRVQVSKLQLEKAVVDAEIGVRALAMNFSIAHGYDIVLCEAITLSTMSRELKM